MGNYQVQQLAFATTIVKVTEGRGNGSKFLFMLILVWIVDFSGSEEKPGGWERDIKLDEVFLQLSMLHLSEHQLLWFPDIHISR